MKIKNVPAIQNFGGGGGTGGADPNNLGWYADLTALQAAHPVGSAGNYAILGSTDTVWVWDVSGSAWTNSDSAGLVTSVNSYTGAVTLAASDVGAVPTTRTVNGKALSADITLSASDVGAAPASVTAATFQNFITLSSALVRMS